MKTFLNLHKSRELYTLSIPHSGDFYWYRKDKKLYAAKDIFSGMTGFERLYVPAYTDADLISWLPAKIHVGKTMTLADVYQLTITKSSVGDYYTGEYRHVSSGKEALYQVSAPSEPEVKYHLIKFVQRKGYK